MKEKTIQRTSLARDTLKGLSSEPKYLLPKYFYDDRGSKIFAKIMQMPEYYLTDCEMEIFREQKEDMARLLTDKKGSVEIIELGPGDGIKTQHLLKHLTETSVPLKYIPVDISRKANNELVNRLVSIIPGINIKPETGDFFKLMKEMNRAKDAGRIILFLGSSIGNLSDDELNDFLSKLSMLTKPNDRVLIGFDLKKEPSVIMQAYDDPHGLTSEFNLNQLARINRELDADFDLQSFKHRQVYDPHSGEMKSYLVSLQDQEVNIAGLDMKVRFRKGDSIFMELSRKFDVEQVNHMASSLGFNILKNFTDKRNYFLDSLWLRL
ncbi:MAG: L-histidine N(alpha)-methyltransferase [Bacteroidota bacterium]|nr:L-histidine N(alpha)-methyltransferase [Bacteroidota bacterium]